MIQSEHNFKWSFFKFDPTIRLVKKCLNYKIAGDNYSYMLIQYTIEKKFLFFFKRKYVTYKKGFYVTYEDQNNQRQLKIEEWAELKKGIYRPTKIVPVKNNVVEGESVRLVW